MIYHYFFNTTSGVAKPEQYTCARAHCNHSRLSWFLTHGCCVATSVCRCGQTNDQRCFSYMRQYMHPTLFCLACRIDISPRAPQNLSAALLVYNQCYRGGNILTRLNLTFHSGFTLNLHSCNWSAPYLLIKLPSHIPFSSVSRPQAPLIVVFRQVEEDISFVCFTRSLLKYSAGSTLEMANI